MNFDSTSDPPRASILDRWLAMRRRGKGVGGAGAHHGALSDPGEGSALTQILRRLLEPESGAETAGLVGAGFTPGVGEAMDMGEMYLGAVDKDPMRMGLAALGLAIPFSSARSIKEGVSATGRGIKSLRDRILLHHGSKAKFAPTVKNPLGEFSDEMNRTGSGMALHGPGHYLSRNPDVANEYRGGGRWRYDPSGIDAAEIPIGELSYLTSSGKSLPDFGPEEIAMSYFGDLARRNMSGGRGLLPRESDLASRIMLDSSADMMRDVKSIEGGSIPRLWRNLAGGDFHDTRSVARAALEANPDASIKTLEEASRWAKDAGSKGLAGLLDRGYLYDVALDASPGDFLPLNDRLIKSRLGRRLSMGIGARGSASPRSWGAELHDSMRSDRGKLDYILDSDEAIESAEQSAVDILKKYGALGVRGGGDRVNENFTVFDSAPLDILRRRSGGGLVGGSPPSRVDAVMAQIRR